MTLNTFLHLFKEHGSVTFGKWVWWYKSKNLWNSETDETIPLETIDNGYNHVIDGKSIREHITDADIHIWDIVLNDKGKSPKGSRFRFSMRNEHSGSVKANEDLPARANNKIKTKTEKHAINEFRKAHGKSNIEHSISVTKNGFVNGYTHGNEGSVIPSSKTKKGDLIIHNHPNRSYGKASHFSGADLVSTAKTNTRGVVATFDGGYHKFEKGTHFKAEKFASAVKNTSFTGDNLDHAISGWLTRNQKKYGYKYETHLDKKSKSSPKPKQTKLKDSKTKTPRPKKTDIIATSAGANGTLLKWQRNGQGALF